MIEKKYTFCRICEAACGLEAEVEAGRVRRLAPDPEHVLSRGYACVKGVRYAELHNSPDRLRTPLKRVGDRFVAIGWQQAFEEIGAKLRAIRAERGPHAIASYAGNPSAFNLLHALCARAWLGALGSSNAYTAASQDCNNKFVVAEHCYGSAMLQPVVDIDHVQCLVLLGTNPAISHMSFVQVPRPVERLKAIEARGGTVVSINPRRTETAKQVGEHVPIRPGTDVFLLLAFAREVFERGGVDPEAHAHLDNVEALRALVSPWTAERVQEITGVEAERLRQLVTRFVEADGAALYCSTGVNQGQHGTLAFWLISAINALTGNLDRPGGLLVPPAQVRGAKLLSAMSRRMTPRPSRIGGFSPILGAYPAAILPDEILTEGQDQVRALIVTAGNPVLSCANSERMRRALSELELLVSIDLFRNETGNLAHYVLPVTSSLERADVPLAVQGFQPVPYFQYTEAVVEADGEQQDEWWIFTHLARAAGVSLFAPPMQWWMQASVPLGRGWLPRWLRYRPSLTYQAVALGAGTTLGAARRAPHGKLLKPLKAGTFLGKALPRAGGRMDVAPDAMLDLAAQLERDFEAERGSLGKLKLITKRERTTHNTWMHNAPSLVRAARSTNHAHLHPTDARRLGVADGELLALRTPIGEVRVPVKLSEDISPGVVAVPHGWGRQAADGMAVAAETGGDNINRLAADGPDAVERLSGMTHLTAIAVQAQPVEADRARGPAVDHAEPAGDHPEPA